MVPEQLTDGVLDAPPTAEVQRYRDSAAEARALADRINTWITVDDVPADEIAVFVGKQVGPYTEALRAELRAEHRWSDSNIAALLLHCSFGCGLCVIGSDEVVVELGMSELVGGADGAQ